MTIIREHAALSDAWAVTHLSSPTSNIILPPPEALIQFGVTADSPLNSYSAGKHLDPHARKFWGKRLDYILYRQPSRLHVSENNDIPTLHCQDCKVVLTDTVPGHDFSFSDHFGVEATLEIHGANGTKGSSSPPESLHASSSSLRNPAASPELSSASITSMIHALAACYRFSRHRARQELMIFGLCIFLLVALAVGSSWLPSSWINPIFILFTVFIAWLGTTMLYEGFLYGQWECNALMNVIEELEIYKNEIGVHSGRHRISGSI